MPRFITDGEPTIAKWVDHVEHISRVAGIEHVGVGADFFEYLGQIGASPGIAEWNPEPYRRKISFAGMVSPEDLPGLTAELSRRGFLEGDMRKIYRDNYLRVLSAALG